MVQDFVLFRYDVEVETFYGLLLADGNIICLDCGGIVEPEDYIIVERFGTEQIHYINETLKQYF